MRKYLILIILALSLMSCIKDDEPQFSNTKQGNFDALWYVIDTRYCYLDYKNIDWDSVRIAYEPQLSQITNKYALFDLFAQMLAVLKDGHVNLISEFDMSRYWKLYTDYPDNFNSSIIYKQKYLGDNYRIAGGLRYARIADEQVGYIYYGSFSSGFSGANIVSIIQQFADCKGIIIDVRDNGGGTLTYAESLASYFFDTDQITGYICHKTGNGHSDFSEPLPIITKGNQLWDRKVAVLTNRMSFSATNDFVCRMQYAPHAIIVGDRTGGGGGLPFSSELPIGWSLRFSASPSFDRDMNQIEDGIEPTVKIDMDTTDNNNDAIIDKAVELILE